MRTIRIMSDDYCITAHATGVTAEFEGREMAVSGDPVFQVVEVYDFVTNEYLLGPDLERAQTIANEPRKPGNLNDALTEELFDMIEDEYDALFPDSVVFEDN